MKKKLKVLSLFDGISCARVALERAGFEVEKYYASETDKYAIQITQKNYPDIIQLGDVKNINGKVLCLSGVYDILKVYDNNIQNKLSEQEMLYWLNEDFSISAKVGTQVKNGDSSKPTSLQCVEEIWFSKSGVGNIIKTQNPERCGNSRSEGDKFSQEPILQCGKWWYVYRSNTGNTKENIARANGQKIKATEYRKDTTVCDKTIQHTASEKRIIGSNQERNVETEKQKELSTRIEKSQEWSSKEIRNRKEKARSYVQEVSNFISSKNDNERITAREWNFLSIHKEMETTMVSSSSSIDIFIGTFGLLCGGSPCQDLSIAKKDRKGLKGERSGLFWEYARILKELKPKYFILENVASMKKDDKDIISKALGVEPIMINAALVSAQQRKRLFWTDIKGIEQPEDKKIYLKDILENKNFYGLYSDYNNSTTYEKARTIGTGCGVTRSATCQQVITKPVRIAKIGKGGQGDRVYSIEGKSINLSANGGGRGAKTGLYAVKDFVRKLTPVECERLQCLPDNYTEGLSNTQRYKTLGNAFNVDVVAHILKQIKL